MPNSYAAERAHTPATTVADEPSADAASEVKRLADEAIKTAFVNGAWNGTGSRPEREYEGPARASHTARDGLHAAIDALAARAGQAEENHRLALGALASAQQRATVAAESVLAMQEAEVARILDDAREKVRPRVEVERDGERIDSDLLNLRLRAAARQPDAT